MISLTDVLHSLLLHLASFCECSCWRRLWLDDTRASSEQCREGPVRVRLELHQLPNAFYLFSTGLKQPRPQPDDDTPRRTNSTTAFKLKHRTSTQALSPLPRCATQTHPKPGPPPQPLKPLLHPVYMHEAPAPSLLICTLWGASVPL